MKKTILICVVLLFLLYCFNLEVTTKNKHYQLTFTGLVWVALDYYTIVKYKSPCKPMKLIVFKINKVNPK